MNEQMLKMLKAKKKPSNMSDEEKEAKMGVMKELGEMADEAMGSKLKGLKKVSVTSDSKEGLKEGVEKAAEMIKGAAPNAEEEREMEPVEVAQDGEGSRPGADALEEAQEAEPKDMASHPMEEEDVGGKHPDDMSDEEIDEHLNALMEAKRKRKPRY